MTTPVGPVTQLVLLRHLDLNYPVLRVRVQTVDGNVAELIGLLFVGSFFSALIKEIVVVLHTLLADVTGTSGRRVDFKDGGIALVRRVAQVELHVGALYCLRTVKQLPALISVNYWDRDVDCALKSGRVL